MENYRSIAKITSERINIPETEVKQVLDLIGKEIKEELENLNNIEVYIYGLGSFISKKGKILQLINYFEAKKLYLKSKDFNGRDNQIIDCDIKIEKLKRLHILYQEKDQRRKNFKNEQTDRDIQEQEADLGRIEEQFNKE